jgi:hypothetical protein
MNVFFGAYMRNSTVSRESEIILKKRKRIKKWRGKTNLFLGTSYLAHLPPSRKNAEKQKLLTKTFVFLLSLL